MNEKKNVVLPVSGALGVGLMCGLYLWKRTAQREARRNFAGQTPSGLTDTLLAPMGWALGETEVFRNLQFLPH